MTALKARLLVYGCVGVTVLLHFHNMWLAGEIIDGHGGVCLEKVAIELHMRPYEACPWMVWQYEWGVRGFFVLVFITGSLRAIFDKHFRDSRPKRRDTMLMKISRLWRRS